ncbi:hypothetical protein OAG1_18280 [Agarivorans sp. OAG1]|uniref:hypothetical protein n=1 Tax=Agarivorans sp. OAG1 TaxID=3082387 RepID=UPI002B2AF937|nr:hypothetical protein OAG1_18280 [Agarivorans sp. OAG1]
MLAGCPFWEGGSEPATLVITPLPETTPFTEIRLQGEIAHTSSNELRVEISLNSQLPIEAEVENQQFYSWLKLEPGLNSIVVTATVNERYTLTKTLEINFQDDQEAIPTYPPNDTEVIGDSTTLSGTFSSTWPAEDITVYIDDQPIQFELISQVAAARTDSASSRASKPFIYQYRFTHWVSLVDGENRFQLKITSPDSIFYRLFKFLASIIKANPSYSIDLDPANSPTTQSHYFLQGKIQPKSGEKSDLEGVELHISNTQTSDSITLSELSKTQFSANIPLVIGTNTLNVVARRNGRSVANASIAIQREVGDVINNISPPSQATVKTSPIAVSGEVSSTWPLSDIQLKVNNKAYPLSELDTPELFTFSINDLPLSIGKNVIYFQLSTPSGVTALEHHIIYQPDPDVTPPIVTINSVPPTTTASTIKISGKVNDPEGVLSGISRVIVSNNLFSTTFDATLSSDSFSAEVPLSYGENTLSVLAEDLSGNISTARTSIKRLSLVSWKNLSPSNQSIITEPLVTISGELHVPKEAVVDGIRINQTLVIPTLNSSENVYYFAAKNLTLDLGYNVFTLVAQGHNVATATQQLQLVYQPQGHTEVLPPSIQINAPLEGAVINQDELTIVARVVSYGGAVNVLINGQTLSNSDLISYSENQQLITRINKKLPFPANQNNLAITIEVVDSLGNSASTTVNVTRDKQLPTIAVNNYLAIPAVNQVNQSTITIDGSITDNNISSASINNQALSLIPSNTPDQYLFSSQQDMPANGNLAVVISAFDFAGNQVTKELHFQSSSSVNLKPLLPPNNATFMLAESANQVQVAVSYDQLPQNSKVAAWITQQDPIVLNTSATVASGELTLPIQEGDVTIHFAVLDEDNAALARASATVSQVALASVPLVLQKVKPENGAKYAEPNEAIELYFNQKIDLSQLQVSVLETLNGYTYINNDAPGTDFLQAKGYTLQQVFRNREPVSFSLAQLPNATTVAVYPKTPLGYGASVEVEVNYKGSSLSRHQFTTRSLPTLITGAVSDQFNQTLAGIKVEIPALQLSTTTNADGGFAFGYQRTADQPLATGSYTLIINRAMHTPGMSEERRTINIKAQRRNDQGMLRVSQINTALPAEFINSGNQQAALAGGDVKLDLSDAIVLFPDGFDKGTVYVQLASPSTINAPLISEFAPLWAFATQPKGITFDGSVAVDIKLPKYQESYDYLQYVGEYMMLVAYQPDKSVIAPIGVAKINDNRHLISQHPVTPGSLDYIGASWIPHELQSLAAEVADGEKSLLELTAAITKNLSE